MLALGISSARAQQAVIVGPDLEPRVVTLRSFSSKGVGVMDHKGNTQTLPSDQVLRILLDHHAVTPLPDPGTAESRPTYQDDGPGTAYLRDGQVLRGRLHAVRGEDAFVWRTKGVGDVTLSLDDVMSVCFSDNPQIPGEDDDDKLRLTNDETLTGFIDYLSDREPGASDDAVGFVIGDAKDPIDIALSRVDAMRVANKPKSVEPAQGRVRIERVDGTVLHLDKAALSREPQDRPTLRGVALLQVEQPDMSLPLSTLRRIEPLAGRYRLELLTGFEMRLIDGGTVFGVQMPPKIDREGAIRLHAPTTIGFELPAGASRLALTAEIDLDDGVPASQRRLAGCELVVFDGQVEIARQTLAPDQPPRRLNLPLKGRSLRIGIEPGVNGPVLDRVRLSDAEVLISSE